MNRLPLVLAIIIAALMAIVSIPFLLLIWLLGGHDVMDNYIDMLSAITFNL